LYRIDLGREGPEGVEARAWNRDGVLYCYVVGSDHVRDWLHHVLPGARRRERRAGYELAIELFYQDKPIIIGGHSLGGCIAHIAAGILQTDGLDVTLVTFGGKMPQRTLRFPGTYYRTRGDIVPFLTPFRGFVRHTVIGKWRPFWRAHEPKEYYEVMRKAGLR
jgi:hypothetical protein